VSLLLTSPEVRRAYEERYDNAASIIASGMAGRPIHRSPQLVMLGTTSLYGVGSSQYNRLRLPADRFLPGDATQLRFEELGVTEGYGSFHFSDQTMEELRTLMAHHNGGRTVRYIFGEGTSPRMREVRAALDEAGLPSDVLLRHGSPRIVYGVPLARNLREVLLGKERLPDYVLPQGDPTSATATIVRYWIGRWLLRRVESDSVLERLERHDLSYPIRHGARVTMPPDEEPPLFREQ
jgi:hypothetical protein